MGLDRPFRVPGGAPLNFAAHIRRLGHEVYLVSGVGDDDRGRHALSTLQERGISAEFVQVIPGKQTGTAGVELDCDGKPIFRIVRPAAYDCVRLTAPIMQRIAEFQPHWIYFGTLSTSPISPWPRHYACWTKCRRRGSFTM